MDALPQRLRKQIIIGGVTLAAVSVVAMGVFIARQVTDESNHVLIRYADEESVRQNEEQGIVALVATEQYHFQGSGEHQFVALLRNPNDAWHASRVSYRFVVQGEDEKKETLEGTSFIGAGSDRLVIASFSDDEFVVEQFSFTVESVDWVDARDRALPAPRVRQTIFETTSPDSARVTGRAVNDSELTIADIEIGIVARNQEGAALGVGLVAVDSLGGGEEKEIEYIWSRGMDGVATLSFFPVAESVSRSPN